ncbi:CP3A4-like protein, partial [Mya arenaria]
GQLEAMCSWERQYGRVFGYYEGWTPVISVADPDILREILVKDFNNYRSRKPFPLAPRKSLGLFLENGDQWKRSRASLTPAFSTGKLRQMFSQINDSVDHLVCNTEGKCGESFDIYNLYQRLTLDVIGRCAFGLQTNVQTDENDDFLLNIRVLFDGLSKTIIQPLVMLVPFFSHFLFALKNLVFLFGMNPVMRLRNQMREVVRVRKQMGHENIMPDLVQLMVFPNCEGSKSTRKNIEPMSDREIVAQSMTFLLAGYETTSAVLAFLTHALATNDDVQNKLCEEVDEVLKSKEVTYEMVNKMPFFDTVIDEVCRLYPTASMIVTRVGAKERVYNGVRLPAGMAIQGNVWALHRDPELWEEPEEFRPERFSAENKPNIKPYSYLPFGAGPRMCIGMRFALLEIKVAVGRILQNFTFAKSCETT